MTTDDSMEDEIRLLEQRSDLCTCGRQMTLAHALSDGWRAVCLCGKRTPYYATFGEASWAWDRQSLINDNIDDGIKDLSRMSRLALTCAYLCSAAFMVWLLWEPIAALLYALVN